MTRKHGPDAFVVLLEDGGAVATVGPFREQEVQPKRSGVKANVYPLSAPSGVFINYVGD